MSDHAYSTQTHMSNREKSQSNLITEDQESKSKARERDHINSPRFQMRIQTQVGSNTQCHSPPKKVRAQI